MKKLSIEFFITYIFLCVTFSIDARSNDFSYPDSLFKEKKFLEAAVEYEKVQYFSEDVFLKQSAIFKKATCYKALGDYQKAITNFERIDASILDKSFSYNVLLQKALCSYLLEKFETTYAILDELFITFKNDSLLIKDAYLIAGFSKIKQMKISEAKQCFVRYVVLDTNNKNNVIILSKLDNCFRKDNFPKFKTQKRGDLCSYIPGMGIVYAGKPLEGLFNFSIQLAALLCGIYEVYYGFYVTGYLVASVTIEKFYFGGRKRTAFLIDKYNYNQINIFEKEINKSLLP